MTAELLLHVGILTRWIGSKNQVKESSQIASDLISESITYWESQTDAWKVPAARAEPAICYWREGALDNARVMFTEALKKLTTEGNTRANALLGLAEAERASSRQKQSRISIVQVGRFKVAPEYLTEARRLAVNAKEGS